MTGVTQIERLGAHIRTAANSISYYQREVIEGMPMIDVVGMPAQADRARREKAQYETEFAARRLFLIGGDATFGGATAKDPHPSKRKGTGMERLLKQFFIEADGQLPELSPSGDPGSVLNKYSMTRYFLQGNAAEVLLSSDLPLAEREEMLFPILVKLDTIITKEESLRAELKAR